MTQADKARTQRGGRSPHQGRSATIIFHGDRIPAQVLRYTLSLLQHGMTVAGFMFKGDYRMPIFVPDTDPAAWKAVEEENRDMQRHWMGIPSHNTEVRIYTLYLPFTVEALTRAIELADKGLSVVGFFAHDETIEPLTAGVLGPDEYTRLIGATDE